MSSFIARHTKQADDGKPVYIYTDAALAWFVGRPGDEQFDPHPMGAFVTEEAARAWADHKFPGGEWRSARL